MTLAGAIVGLGMPKQPLASKSHHLVSIWSKTKLANPWITNHAVIVSTQPKTTRNQLTYVAKLIAIVISSVTKMRKLSPEELVDQFYADDLESAKYLLTLPDDAFYLLEHGCFVNNNQLHLNLGDVFAYCGADAETISVEEIPLLAELHRKYGWAGPICWAAKKRNEDPVLEIRSRLLYVYTWRDLYGDLKVNDNECNKLTPKW
jgi:hypothetical protein